jgi:hypothetical protein
MQRETFGPVNTANCLTVHPALGLRPRCFSEKWTKIKEKMKNDIPIGNKPGKGRYIRNERAQIKNIILTLRFPLCMPRTTKGTRHTL